MCAITDFKTQAKEKIDTDEQWYMTKDDARELVTMIQTSKTDTIKWMFIFWIGQLAATAWIVFAFIKK